MMDDPGRTGGAMRTRVKICGIRRREDAMAAIGAGADALGFVFHAPSPRAIAPPEAAALARFLPPFVARVGLFVDAEESRVREVLAQVPLDLLQFHGQEPLAWCGRFGRPWMKAVRMGPDVDLAGEMAALAEAGACAVLVDAWHPAVAGGTGETFDWDRIPENRPLPLVLAGGLTPENVGEAIRRVRPYAVDVSSGVERSKGVKDPDRIRAFLQTVTSVSADG